MPSTLTSLEPTHTVAEFASSQPPRTAQRSRCHCQMHQQCDQTPGKEQQHNNQDQPNFGKRRLPPPCTLTVSRLRYVGSCSSVRGVVALLPPPSKLVTESQRDNRPVGDPRDSITLRLLSPRLFLQRELGLPSRPARTPGADARPPPLCLLLLPLPDLERML